MQPAARLSSASPAPRAARSFVGAAVAVVALAAAGDALASAPNPLPPLPGSGAAGASAAAPASADPRRGLVYVERDGKAVAVGTVLGGDGRVITALSAVEPADVVDIRYPDGAVVKASVGHKDAGWDLALLVPLTGKRTEGLRAGEADPTGADLRTFSPSKATPQVVIAKVQRKFDGRAKNGDVLPSALEVETKGAAAAGAPLVDATGTVLGIVVRACRPDDAKGPAPASKSATHAKETGVCATTLIAAPIAALRHFLASTPATAARPAPFLGIAGAAEAGSAPIKGVRVVAVAPSSPAERGALKPSVDVIVAVDGKPVDSPDKLAEVIASHGVGDTVKLLVFGGDRLREVAVALERAP